MNDTYTAKERRDFLRQAEFLRGLAEQVRAYNADGTKAGIEMSGLAKTLEETACECEDEAKYAGHMEQADFLSALMDCVGNNSNLEASEEDSPLFTGIHTINGYQNGSFTVHFVDGVSYNVKVTAI